MKLDPTRACHAPGPTIKVSDAYERQAICNRLYGHPGKHAERRPETFAVMAEWTRQSTPRPGKHKVQ